MAGHANAGASDLDGANIGLAGSSRTLYTPRRHRPEVAKKTI